MKQPVKPRWQYRFDNYKRAFLLLREAIEMSGEREVSQLEKEGIIQRFEYTWELAWKVLKDYLEHQGIVLDTITPAAVIRSAFAANVIEQGDVWMRALDARNKMSHTYDLNAFEQIIKDIRTQYLPILDSMHVIMLQRLVEDNRDNSNV